MGWLVREKIETSYANNLLMFPFVATSAVLQVMALVAKYIGREIPLRYFVPIFIILLWLFSKCVKATGIQDAELKVVGDKMHGEEKGGK